MTTLPPRSPGLRLARNLALLWMGLSLLGLLGAIVFVVYAMGWGCSEGSMLRGGLSWFGCVMASSVSIMAAIASLITATVVLFFAQIFYLAGAQVRQGGPSRPRWFSRQALFGDAADVAVDAVVDATDILD